jgi:hypothetical protein
VLYGVTGTGWHTPVAGTNFKTESVADGWARIQKTYGKLGMYRSWNGTPAPVPGQPVYYDGTVSAQLVQQLDALNTLVVISQTHEPENDSPPVTAAQVKSWQNAMMAAGKIVHDNSDKVLFAPCLMGSSYMVMPGNNRLNRYTEAAQGNVPWSTWFDFDLTNIDAFGADCYQHGNPPSRAFDTAAEVIQPVIDAARSKSKKAILGELGARRVDKSGLTPSLPDADRAQFLTDAIALGDANADVMIAMLYFDASNGTPNMTPWNHVPPPGYTGDWSPKALAVWKAACNR